ncbi:ABC transporter substrate-binding protein [Actinophytocola algeriensis]|uniref:Branched-chain amino acid transport system substrate-binding protein n=1 Tax=Actinophytocola algeriensis TaxID=1768010 RepID=A0A7W7Q865_9PSEU|nr:ABC transporter substrate-binding protein [Actinophytocola algeriensis]MBB4908830.1 branched-chain amino acid transport system substrate-binding protein [Actinophytocola algeriensis]MBE1474783.1 branched-chain amino acid transport system substrate-binding protein [Actinophytocola algeriensis]
MSQPLIGVVLAATGRLAPLGVPLDFVARALPWPVGVLVRDSGSTAGGARVAALSLVEAGVRVVVTLGGTETLPAVAGVCTEREVPCVSTTLPWQVFAAGHQPGWAFHFGWGLDDIAVVFADLWEYVGQARVVGCLWNDGTQGEALRRWFRPVAAARGHELVDLPYRESGGELPDVAGVEVVTGAATATDLATALRHRRPRLVTCSRWLTYPFSVAQHGLDRVATIVSWTPEHAHRAAVRTPRDLAAAYEAATGSGWLQPLGLAHALMEVACHAVASADSREGLAAVLARTRLATLAGVLDWTAGPVPGVATIPLAGGQWRARPQPELVVVDNRRAPVVPVGGELLVGP